MKKLLVLLVGIIAFFVQNSWSQNRVDSVQKRNLKLDTAKNPFSLSEQKFLGLRQNSGGGFEPSPSNVVTDVKFDPVSNRYVVTEKIGDKPIREPLYLTVEQYLRYKNTVSKKEAWKQIVADNIQEANENGGFLKSISVNDKFFNKVFGGGTIDIKARGEAQAIMSLRINKNENPLLSLRQRRITTLDFDQIIQANMSAQFGKNLKISTNYNTAAQFDFENRVKVEYTGKQDLLNKIGQTRDKITGYANQVKNFGNGTLPDMTGKNLMGGQDGIIKNIEAGNVSMPLTGTLISGAQSLFGIKTQLQFGRLFVTALASQQRSQSKSIQISNGAQQNEFTISASDYDVNKHYFLAQYFRDHYNKFMSQAPYVTSGINITRIEAWVTNKNNAGTSNYQDARDILALLDLAENKPYNTQLLTGGGSELPSGFIRPSQPNQSNNILTQLPQGYEFTNNTAVENYFASAGSNDNYAKLTYARRLNQMEYTYNPYLGYISLNSPLNNDEVLSVAYRYTYNGREYQVGQFSSDVPNNPNNPTMLVTKMLKNENTRVYLPTWRLMMKNIYTLNTYNLSRDNFRLNIFRLDETSGIDRPIMADGSTTKGKLWIQILGLDRLNQQMQPQPDGVFDFMAFNSPFGNATGSAFGNSLNTTNSSNNSFGNNGANNGFGGNDFSNNSFNSNSNFGNSALGGGNSFGSGGMSGADTYSASSPVPNLNTNNIGGYVTIDPQKGRIIFPYIEPFGRDLEAQFQNDQTLIDKYAFRELYDSLRTVAKQYFPNKDRYNLRGSFQSTTGSVFQLNAFNIPEGSVRVIAGNMPLQEGVDYTVDYQGGTVSILNTALLNSGQPITINTEDNSSFGQQSRSLLGTRLDYKVNPRLQLGATLMNLTEKPITPKVNIGNEPISNTMFGVDATYSAPSRLLTRMVDKLPFISTKAPSNINFFAEYAQFLPGNPPGLNFAGSGGGTTYLDDFEGSQSSIDLKSAPAWQISSTPERFPEAQLSNDLSYGYNRSRLAFYNIDPAFYNTNRTLNPLTEQKVRTELANHYVRRIIEQEIFPAKNQVTQTQQNFPTLDLVFYPNIRGPYNFTTTGVNSDGTLTNPTSRWGGIFRKMDNPDFETANVQYIEFWVMDPFIYKPNAKGGDLYFNLGNISEDILKDGRKSIENGLPTIRTSIPTDETAWGIVPRTQPVVQTFDADETARKQQDVGLDGLNSDNELLKFGPQLQSLQGMLQANAMNDLNSDPSSDDYVYYRGPKLDAEDAGILRRYERYNGTEGNSKTTKQSQDELGVDNAASTPLPDAEDINRDNSMTTINQYYEYKVSVRPEDMMVGKNFITDKIISSVKLINGASTNVAWYQFRIPISQYDTKVGDINDFKSIRFIRMYMTNFTDTAILRFGEIGLVRGDWRIFNPRNQSELVIKDADIMSNADQSEVEVGSVSIEANSNKEPIPYVVPPGIQREVNLNNIQTDTRLNEQALLMNVKNLREGYGRAVFRTALNDFRSYERLQMFVHAESLPEANPVNDGELFAFIRLGIDNNQNYYEYQKPLKVTLPGKSDPYSVWPEDNNFDFNISIFQNAKVARNNARLPNGQSWPVNRPFTYTENNETVVVLGQPDLSKVRVYMLGVKNPTLPNDDGANKSIQVWFNEMRLTGFQRSGGWAVNGRVDAQLADLGNVSVAGSYKTAGFSALDTKIGSINRFTASFFDLTTNLDLGKFFKSKSGIKIPMFFNWSSQISTPEYDPRSPDLLLSKSLNGANQQQRDSILNFSQDYTIRRGLFFNNVRKEHGLDNKRKSHLWDIENFSFSYGFSNVYHRDFINQNSVQSVIRGNINYNFSHSPKNYQPFNKLIKSKYLGLIKDFNFTLLPSSLSFRIDGNRFYSENTLRNNDAMNFLPDIATQFNKNFSITRLYGVQWDLTKSLQLDFNALNYSLVDEPYGKINNQQQRDSVWQNLLNLGRTTSYGHNIGLRYTLPLNKIPGFDWVNATAEYTTRFDWQADPTTTGPFAALNNPAAISFGNTIQNSRSIQFNPTLDFTKLYRKLPLFKRKMYDPEYQRGFADIFLDILLGIKNLGASYRRTDGTYLPGYSKTTNGFFGLDRISGAPGLGFILGEQTDIRTLATNGNWLTNNPLQSQLFVNTLNDVLNFKGMIQPIPGMTINLIANRQKMTNFTTNFKFSDDAQSFASLSPNTQGNFSISTISLGSAFKDQNISSRSKVYEQFLKNREVISARLGSSNPNSTGLGTDGYADGYNKNSQDVLVAAFNAAYLNKNSSNSSLSSFSNIPLPNWDLTYKGLINIPIVKSIFNSFDITHAYQSMYSISGFNSYLDYTKTNGAVSSRDNNGNFLPEYQFQQVTIAESFAPLIGIKTRFKSNLTASLDYSKNRLVNLSFVNSQLVQMNENIITVGLGYRTNKFRFPFGLFADAGENNELNFAADLKMNDSKTLVFTPEVNGSEISAGARLITLNPNLEYQFKKRYVFRVFYNSNLNRPYTSQTFNTSFTNLGFSIRFILN